jgi:2-isopropylmalate synthase
MADFSTLAAPSEHVGTEPRETGHVDPAPVTRESQLIFDWNEVERKGRILPDNATFFDETLRDGLQNPSVKDPPVADKLALLHLMEDVGIHGANVGLPSSSPRAFDDVLRLCKEVVDARMKIKVACAGRTVAADIIPMIEVSQKAGLPVEAYVFIGSSPIRQYVERWDLALIAKRSAEAINVAVKSGLSVAYVTEDTTRSRPEVLTTLFRAAIEHGATRLCLSDTVGHATPDGVRNLIKFVKQVVATTGVENIGLDWHGHNDRGLALVNALWAFECGADRVHGTGLGIGERVGNAQMELILLNLKLLGQLGGQDLTRLLRYCETVAEAFGCEIPKNYPLVGRDAFRTATGVHAAAILKAGKHDPWLADRVYSGVPAGMFGRKQEICIGFMSGASNVSYWLAQRGIAGDEGLVSAILAAAKAENHILSDEEVMSVVRRVQGGSS